MRHTSLMLFIGVAAAGISVFPANATVRIISDPGGPVVEYLDRFLAARVSGEPIIIDGACLSACTLAIGVLPRRQVCATPKAVLGFHAAWRRSANGGRVTSPLVTELMYELYPANVRKWIARHGGLSERLILLKASLPPWCRPATLDPSSAHTKWLADGTKHAWPLGRDLSRVPMAEHLRATHRTSLTPTRVITGMLVFAFGILAGAGIAAWLMPAS